MTSTGAHPRPRLLPDPIVIAGVHLVSGSARGRRIGIPTLNIELASAPKELAYGIYACLIFFGGATYKGGMHYGPRPVFKDTETFEVHVLDAVIDEPPSTIDLKVIAKIRDVKDFPSTEALKEAIAEDFRITRMLLR